jgi:sugar O-acyltransferase (sialic acid O-acetyltransferase NeuD family)
MTAPVLIVGAGGHAKVLVDALLACGIPIVGLIDADPAKTGSRVLGVEVIGGDTAVGRFAPADIVLVNGVGTVASTAARRGVFERFKAQGYRFATVIHPSAVVAPSARLADGVQVMAGCVIQAESAIGQNAIVNTRASVDHDCVVGAHVHIAPGVTLSGGVRVGDNTHIGSGSTVLQGIAIGADCVVGAGSVVLANVPAGSRVGGVPAAPLR